MISGDTRFTENTIKYGKGVDLLIHGVHAGLDEAKASQGNRPQRGSHHTGPKKAGEIFARAKPKLAVYTHIILGRKSEQDLIDLTRQTYAGPLAVGKE